MAKTQAKTTLSPLQYGLGRPILADGARDPVLAVVRMQNWMMRRRQSQIALTTGGDGWDSTTNAPGTIGGTYNDALLHTLIDTDLLLDGDVLRYQLLFAAEISPLVGINAVTVVCSLTGSLGTVTGTLNFTNADTTERTVAITGLTAAIADGDWIHTVITCQRSAGAAAYTVLEVELEESAQSTSLPDVTND